MSEVSKKWIEKKEIGLKNIAGKNIALLFTKFRNTPGGAKRKTGEEGENSKRLLLVSMGDIQCATPMVVNSCTCLFMLIDDCHVSSHGPSRPLGWQLCIELVVGHRIIELFTHSRFVVPSLEHKPTPSPTITPVSTWSATIDMVDSSSLNGSSSEVLRQQKTTHEVNFHL